MRNLMARVGLEIRRLSQAERHHRHVNGNGIQTREHGNFLKSLIGLVGLMLKRKKI